jgi:hypothetical protein
VHGEAYPFGGPLERWSEDLKAVWIRAIAEHSGPACWFAHPWRRTMTPGDGPKLAHCARKAWRRCPRSLECVRRDAHDLRDEFFAFKEQVPAHLFGTPCAGWPAHLLDHLPSWWEEYYRLLYLPHSADQDVKLERGSQGSRRSSGHAFNMHQGFSLAGRGIESEPFLVEDSEEDHANSDYEMDEVDTSSDPGEEEEEEEQNASPSPAPVRSRLVAGSPGSVEFFELVTDSDSDEQSDAPAPDNASKRSASTPARSATPPPHRDGIVSPSRAAALARARREARRSRDVRNSSSSS